MKSILCLNLGSSSLKFSLFSWETGLAQETDEIVCKSLATKGLDLDAVMDGIAREVKGTPLTGIGHRVVFGGDDHVQPQLVDEALLEKLETFLPLVPLHLPREIDLMRAAARRFVSVPQVASFDTAFHATMPDIAKHLPIPRRLWRTGLRRYGFHGLSYEYVAGRLGDDLRGKVIIAHLGGGASLVALRDGAPIDTTMGLSPLGGLMMGTRPGDLDPGVLLSLMREKDGPEGLSHLLEEQCGLLGVSETSADVAELLARRASDIRAADALDLFVYIARKHIGALTAVLGGLDLLVFTGGIGENAAPIRGAIEAGLAPPRPAVRVIATNENLVLARHTYATIKALYTR